MILHDGTYFGCMHYGMHAQKCVTTHACNASAMNQVVRCSADLKVLEGRLLASCDGASKLGSAVFSWKQRSA